MVMAKMAEEHLGSDVMIKVVLIGPPGITTGMLLSVNNEHFF